MALAEKTWLPRWAHAAARRAIRCLERPAKQRLWLILAEAACTSRFPR